MPIHLKSGYLIKHVEFKHMINNINTFVMQKSLIKHKKAVSENLSCIFIS